MSEPGKTAIRYKTGDTCPVAGLFRFDGYIDGDPSAAEMEIRVSPGTKFPVMGSAQKESWWRLRRQFLTDTDRLTVMGATNIIGIIAVVVSYFLLNLRECLDGPQNVNVWFLLQGFLIVLMFVIPDAGNFLPRLRRAARLATKKPDERVSFKRMLRILIIANFVTVGWLIIITGGIYASPFSSYGIVMVVMGQFLLEQPGRRIWLFPVNSLKLAFYGLLFYAAVYFVDQCLVKTTFIDNGAKQESIMSHVLLVVVLCVLIIGSYTSSQDEEVTDLGKEVDEPS